jgi:SAM-dependent methyltransferase
MIDDVYQGRQYANRPNYPLLEMVPAAARSVLDVGCGMGANLNELRARGRRPVGVTLSRAEAATVRAQGHECVVADCSRRLPFSDGAFDAIILSHVLEHLPWPEQAVRGLPRLLEPGGLIFVAVPNVMFFRTRLRLVAGRFPREATGVFDETHLRWFTWATPEELAARAGCTVVAKDGDAWFREIRWVPRWLGRVAVRARPNLCAQQIRFALRPAEATAQQDPRWLSALSDRHSDRTPAAPPSR